MTVQRSRGTSYQTREPRCAAEGPHKMHCSLEPEHTGDHQAHGMKERDGTRRVLAHWPKAKRRAA